MYILSSTKFDSRLVLKYTSPVCDWQWIQFNKKIGVNQCNSDFIPMNNQEGRKDVIPKQ